MITEQAVYTRKQQRPQAIPRQVQLYSW